MLYKEIRSTYRTARLTEKQIMAIFKRTPLGIYIDPFLDWTYGIALTAALFKDISDLTGLGSLPIIGTLITIIVWFVIWFIMFITRAGMKRMMVKFIVRKLGVLFGGTFIEFIPILNFFPTETLIVVVVFYLLLRERKEADLQDALEENKKGYSVETEPAYS
jgi:hypothetical protein